MIRFFLPDTPFSPTFAFCPIHLSYPSFNSSSKVLYLVLTFYSFDFSPPTLFLGTSSSSSTSPPPFFSISFTYCSTSSHATITHFLHETRHHLECINIIHLSCILDNAPNNTHHLMTTKHIRLCISTMQQSTHKQYYFLLLDTLNKAIGHFSTLLVF